MFLVHLHLLANHIPVIGIPIAAFVLLVALRMRNSDMAKLGLVLLAGIAALSAIAYYTGEPATDAVRDIAGVTRDSIHEHEEAADFAFIGACLAGAFGIALLWIYRRRALPRWTIATGFAAALLVGAIMARTAYLGGYVRHSEIHASPPTDSTS